MSGQDERYTGTQHNQCKAGFQPKERRPFDEEHERVLTGLNGLVGELTEQFTWPSGDHQRSTSVAARVARAEGRNELAAALAAVSVNLSVAPLGPPNDEVEWPTHLRARPTKDPKKIMAAWLNWPDSVAGVKSRNGFAALLESEGKATEPPPVLS